MLPPSVTLVKNKYWLFLICLAIVLMILGAIATSRYGAGVTSDSVKYMAVAQNLLDGNGLYDHRGWPLLAWPPLYSMSLAGLAWLTGMDVFIVGWYLNILLLSLNLILSGIIFRRVFANNPSYAYLASLFVFLSISSLRNHATLGSDAPYLTMTLAFLLALDDYIRKRSYTAFAWMVLLSALAPLLRYVGLAFTVTALLVILIEQRKSMSVLWRDGPALGFLSALPIFWWLVIHNIMGYGSLWGGYDSPGLVDVRENIELALTKMLHWFVPYLSFLMPLLTRPFIVLGFLAVILILINFRSSTNWLVWSRSFLQPTIYPSMIYALVYFFAVAFTIITSDHRYLHSDRYYFIMLVPTMIFVFITFDSLVRPHLKFTATRINNIMLLVFLLWTAYPIYGLREYLADALERGEPSDYNLFNTRAYHEMNVVPEMQKLRQAYPEALMYSNYVDAVWFYTRKPALLSPVRGAPDLNKAYAGWPYDKPGYLVWFKPNEYKHYLSPQELSRFSELKLIYSDPSGDIYYVSAR
jgi:hypothetical protein